MTLGMPKMQPNINNAQAWADEMRKNGYTNLMFYTEVLAGWMKITFAEGLSTPLNLVFQNFWVAQYLLKTTMYEAMRKVCVTMGKLAPGSSLLKQVLPGKHLFDHNCGLCRSLTANAKPAAGPTEAV